MEGVHLARYLVELAGELTALCVGEDIVAKDIFCADGLFHAGVHVLLLLDEMCQQFHHLFESGRIGAFAQAGDAGVQFQSLREQLALLCRKLGNDLVGGLLSVHRCAPAYRERFARTGDADFVCPPVG